MFPSNTASAGLHFRGLHFKGNDKQKASAPAENPASTENTASAASQAEGADTWEPGKLLRTTSSTLKTAKTAPSGLTQMLKSLVLGRAPETPQASGSQKTQKHARFQDDAVQGQSSSKQPEAKRPPAVSPGNVDQIAAADENEATPPPSKQRFPHLRVPSYTSDRTGRPSLSPHFTLSEAPLNEEQKQQLEDDLRDAMGESALESAPPRRNHGKLPAIQLLEPVGMPRSPHSSLMVDVTTTTPSQKHASLKSRSSSQGGDRLAPPHGALGEPSSARRTDDSSPKSSFLTTEDSASVGEEAAPMTQGMLIPSRGQSRRPSISARSEEGSDHTSWLFDSDDEELNAELDARDEGMFNLSPGKGQTDASAEPTRASREDGRPRSRGKKQAHEKSSPEHEFAKSPPETFLSTSSMPRNSLLSEGLRSPKAHMLWQHNLESEHTRASVKATIVQRQNHEYKTAVSNLCNQNTLQDLRSRLGRLAEDYKKEQAALSESEPLEALRNQHQALEDQHTDLITQSENLIAPRLKSTRSAVEHKAKQDQLTQALTTVLREKSKVNALMQRHQALKKVRMDMDKYTDAIKLKVDHDLNQTLAAMPEEHQEQVALAQQLAKEFTTDELAAMKAKLNKKELNTPIEHLHCLDKAISFKTP